MWKQLGVCLAALTALNSISFAQSGGNWDTYSDTWVATDGLNRELPNYPKVSAPRTQKKIAMFYFLWMDTHAYSGPHDITKILKQDADAVNKPDSPLWGKEGAFHYWGEPRFGYYKVDDPWVLKKHAQMLTDAGVDLIVFDTSNTWTYKPFYMALLKAFSEVRAEGGDTPQIAFLSPFGDPTIAVKDVWNDLYSKGLYEDLWYKIDGKPLIMADLNAVMGGFGNSAQNLPDRLEKGQALGQTFKANEPFTAVAGSLPTWSAKGSGCTMKLFRSNGQMVAKQSFKNISDNSMVMLKLEQPEPAGTYTMQISNPVGTIGWWSNTGDVYKDGKATASAKTTALDRVFRVIPVNDEAMKIRSFFTARKPIPSYFTGPDNVNQWGWLEVYPQHVFMNSKGEKEQMTVGVAQNAADGKLDAMSNPRSHGRSYHDGKLPKDYSQTELGLNFSEQWKRALDVDPQYVFVTGWNEWIAQRFANSKGQVQFVDLFDIEHSRDIEPMRGGFGDDYYYQFVSYARQFKGARSIPTAGTAKAISLTGDFSQWSDVTPEYRDDIGDVEHRNHLGYHSFMTYTNDTGRNDIVVAKVSRDPQNISFYVRCKNDITSPEGAWGWMQLYLDTDKNHTNGWCGYDYRLNGQVTKESDGLSVGLERSNGGWNWQSVGKVKIELAGKELMVQIPRNLLGIGLSDTGLAIDFKWVDNALKTGDIIELLEDGDTAPNARFNYRYQVK